jgi:ABC-type uncharacterized transport system auxiliary subunit
MNNFHPGYRILLNILLLAGLIPLAGCVNLDPVVDKTEFHVLGVGKRSSVDPVTMRVAIRDVHLVDFIDNSKLVERVETNKVRYLSGHRWAGALSSMIAQVVADEMERSVKGLYVTVGDSAEADINLDLNILQFFRSSDGSVSVSLEYKAINAESKELISEGRISRLKGETSASVSASIKLLEDQLRECSAEIAGKLN